MNATELVLAAVSKFPKEEAVPALQAARAHLQAKQAGNLEEAFRIELEVLTEGPSGASGGMFGGGSKPPKPKGGGFKMPSLPSLPSLKGKTLFQWLIGGLVVAVGAAAAFMGIDAALQHLGVWPYDGAGGDPLGDPWHPTPMEPPSSDPFHVPDDADF